MPALKGGWVDGLQRYTPAGDELVLEGCAPCRLVDVSATQHIGQTVEFLCVEVSPATLRPLSEAFLQKIGPES